MSLRQGEGDCDWLSYCICGTCADIGKGGSRFRDDDYSPLYAGLPGAKLNEEEELALALKASMDTARRSELLRLPAYFLMTSRILSLFWALFLL